MSALGPELFLDQFTGSGSLLGHEPDVNAAAESVWPVGSSGLTWQDDGDTDLSGGRLFSLGSSSSGAGGTILLSADDGLENEGYPAAVYPGGYQVTFEWQPGHASTDASTGALPLDISFDNAEVALYISSSHTARTLNLGSASSGGGPSAAVSYASGEQYTGTITVVPGITNVSFLGVELAQENVYTAADLKFAPIDLYMALGCSMGFLKIVREDRPAFWSGFVNTIEAI